MTIGKYCQLTGAKKKRNQVIAEAHGVVVTAPALMGEVYGDPPAPRDEVRAKVRFCAVCGAEQPRPLPGYCVKCRSPLFAEVGEEDLKKRGSPAGLPERTRAFLIDLVIIAGIAAIAVYLIGGVEGAVSRPPSEELGESMTVSRFFYYLKGFSAAAVFILYHSLFVTLTGATPGKLLFRLRVFLKNGSDRIGLGKSLLRSALYLFSIYVIPIGLLPLIFQESPKKWLKLIERDAMFHDLLTDTVVVRTGA